MRTLVVATLLASTAAARADATDLVTRPLVLAAGQVEAQLTAEINLEQRRIGRPLSLAPDLWYGVTARWTVGVIHSNHSVDRIDPVATLCVRQLATQCDRLYVGSGVEARWSWRAGALAVAPRGRLLVRAVDPVKPALTVGALVRWTRGRFALTSDPTLRVGLANRDLGNRDALAVPLWLGAQPTCRWLVALRTGIDGELATWRDGWHVPFALLVRARATDHLDLGIEAGFPSLFGPQNNFKQRSASVFVSWRS